LNETSGVYSITTFETSSKPDLDTPTVSEITEATEYGLYGFDNFQWVLPVNTVPFAYRFLRHTDTAYWQVTDPDRVWQVVNDDDIDNVENPDFVFASATTVAVTAAVVLISSNLF